MILYAETSAVLRWLFGAPRGDEVRQLLADADSVCASRLTVIEARRALVRATTSGQVTEAVAMEAAANLEAAVARWTIVEILPEIAHRAGQRFPIEFVRTLDAIHLATALFLAPRGVSLAMLSTDDRILENTPLLGLQIALPA